MKKKIIKIRVYKVEDEKKKQMNTTNTNLAVSHLLTPFK